MNRRTSVLRRIGRCTAVIIILVLVILMLQIYNVLLLYQMESRGFVSDSKDERKTMFKWPWILWENGNDFRNPKVQLKRGTLVGLFGALPEDKSGSYKIRWLYVQPNINQSHTTDHDVTLVTQCSPNNLYHLIEMADRWHGPMSIAVFAPGYYGHLSHRYIHELRECSPTLKANASFHVVYPKGHLPPDSEFMFVPLSHRDSCNVVKERARMIPGINYALMEVPYPNNLLRNVAREDVHSQFIFLVDIDTIPSRGLRTQFNSFASKFHLFNPSNAREAVVYVVPVFEIQLGKPIPESKKDLGEAVQSGNARQFYMTRCFKCHSPTDYNRWLNINSGQNTRIQPLYVVEWRDAYEPFYIGRNSAPLYDERFKQYGFNRISQVCETNMAGYRFVILNHAFLVHEGFKVKDEFHAAKDAENAKNRELYQQFKADMKIKYPKSKRSCD